MIQALPAKWRFQAIVIGIGIPQIATPLARLFSSELLSFGQWRTLHLFEFGLTLVTLAAVLLLKLPPGKKEPTYRALDFVSFTLFTGGVALFCAALGELRYLWWADTSWFGKAICASIPLILGALLLDYHRKTPLLATQFIASADILRFLAVGFLVRLALSEQTYGAVGLLNSLGFNNDQFHTLFLIVTVAVAAGSLASAVILDVRRLTEQIIAALVLIAIGAWLDSDATNLTRPSQLYFSQALFAFATTLFLGPALLFGLARSLKKGPVEYITFSVSSASV
jgi:hypothetical protein